MDLCENFTEHPSIIDEAGSRIASFVLIRACHKARCCSRQLRADMNQTLLECQNAKERLDAQKADYYQKQRDVEELTCQLRFTQKEVQELLQSVEEQALRVKSFKDKKEDLATQFSTRCEECLSVNQQISDAKQKLAIIMSNKQELEIQIETSKLKAETISEKCDSLSAELSKLEIEGRDYENGLLRQLGEVENEIRHAKTERTELKSKLKALKDFTREYENIAAKLPGAAIEMERKLLGHEVEVLREAFERTFESKFRNRAWTVGKYIKMGLDILLPVLLKSII